MSTPHTLLSSLFSQYSDERITSCTQLPTTTSGNDAYVIITPASRYVLRILARQETVNIVQEHAFQLALQKAGITTPLYIKTNLNSLIASEDGVACTLSNYIVGERPQHITRPLIYDMGATLAKVQGAMAGAKITPNESQWFDPTNVEHQLERYAGPQKQQVTELIESSSSILSKSLPQALIHGDLHIHNIFARGDKVSVVFDLETVAYTLRILDIARTYLTLVKGTSFESKSIMQSLITGYDSVATTPLINDEKAALNVAVVYVAATTALCIYNNGNVDSSMKYIQLASEYAEPTVC